MSLRLSALFLAAVFTATALADEASVRRGVETRFDGIKVDSVTKTSYGGLYEIVVGETLFYTDENVNFVFKGEIIDARSQKNLTEERQQKLTAIKFDDLPLDLAIKQVRGNGKRVVAIFADPFCPYCKNLDRALLRQDDITIYTFPPATRRSISGLPSVRKSACVPRRPASRRMGRESSAPDPKSWSN